MSFKSGYSFTVLSIYMLNIAGEAYLDIDTYWNEIWYNRRFTPLFIFDALQQTREQVTQAYFEIWAIEVGIGLKNNSYADFEIFVFLHTLYVFFHLHVISD